MMMFTIITYNHMRSTARYMKQYGTSYYYATLFFPSHIKNKVLTLYKFVRIPDLIVDNKNIWSEAAKEELEQMRQDRKLAYETKDSHHAVRWDSVSLFHENYIPFDLSESFWKAMLQDTEKKTYETHHELYEYMHWSAMVVWEMMCHVVWSLDQRAIPYAKKLGEAMQMTNFLRDVKEDWQDFWRIYMPVEDMHRFGTWYRHIKESCETGLINDNREKFMAFQIQRCDWLYKEALHGLEYLPKEVRKAIYLSAKLYQQILRRIEHLHYNVFEHSARTRKSEKFMVLAQHMWKKI